MKVSRRALIQSTFGGALALSHFGADAKASSTRIMPLKSDFYTQGTYLNSAFSHPISIAVLTALQDYVSTRFREPQRLWVIDPARDEAAALFAKLISAKPADIAVVPSTMGGENLITASLGIKPGDKVVTDAFHYFGSLVKYGEMRKGGVDVTVVAPRGGRITPEDLDAAIKPGTRLVALSAVSSHSGFVHDLKQVSEIAHRKGALVYADLIQMAGAIPIDIRASGVDFACCGGQKWLQGDGGAAFLYVRPESLHHLRRTQVGWRQVADYEYHAYPNNAPGPVEGSWTMEPDSAASLLEVSTFSQAPLWALRASIAYVLGIGVDAIVEHRRPLMKRLHAGMRALGYQALAPDDQNSPLASFTKAGMSPTLEERCRVRNVAVSIGERNDYIRVGPSIFNDGDDVELLLEALDV